jgi:hypothetical protein
MSLKQLLSRTICTLIFLILIGFMIIMYGVITSVPEVLYSGIAFVVLGVLLFCALCLIQIRANININRVLYAQQPIVVIVHQPLRLQRPYVSRLGFPPIRFQPHFFHVIRHTKQLKSQWKASLGY